MCPANHLAMRHTSSTFATVLPSSQIENAISRGIIEAAIADAKGSEAARSYASALAHRQSRCALCVSTSPARSCLVMRLGFSFVFAPFVPLAPFFPPLVFAPSPSSSSESESKSRSKSKAFGSSPGSVTSYARSP